MKVISGDLIKCALNGQFDVIIHGCNCYCTMGAGIAKVIKLVFPEAYSADLRTTRGSVDKLGTISYATVIRNNHMITIVNAYTQYNYGGLGVKLNYNAVRTVMKHVKEKFPGKRIGYPRLGAGLARGNWGEISQIIDEVLIGEDHTLVILGGNVNY